MRNWQKGTALFINKISKTKVWVNLSPITVIEIDFFCCIGIENTSPFEDSCFP